MSLYDLAKGLPENRRTTAFNDFTIKKRFLFSASLELTSMCNFRCPFCYARMSPEEIAQKGRRVLDFDAWSRIISELCDMGVANLTLTGGECMLHPDFCRIYEFAYNKGMIITIMSNGSLINEQILDMFKRIPPFRIFITVYGASPETYKKVCGNADYYYTVRKNLAALKDMHMQLVLQYTASEDNIDDMKEVYLYSKELDAPFRYSSFLVQMGRCTIEEIDANCANEDEFTRIAREIWLDKNNLTEEEYSESPLTSMTPKLDNPIVEKGMPCNAGRNTCHIDYKGDMFTCVSLEAFSVSTLDKPVSACWRDILEWSDRIPRITECTNCLHRLHCRHCIAMHYNDTKEFGKPSPRICWKVTHPERAKQAEEFFAENGYLRMNID